MLNLLLGILIGVILTIVVYEVQCRGYLTVDTRDPEDSYLFLEITRGDVRAIMRSRYVIFKTKTQN